MHIRLFVVFLLIFTAAVSLQSHAQEATIKRSTVIEYYKDKPFYIHFVNQGETLNAIAKAYNVTVDEIRIENPSIDKGLKANMVIRIPQKSGAVIPEAEVIQEEKQKVEAKPAEIQNSILYKVKKKETLYGISRQFNVTVDEILSINPGFDGLKEGMDLKIPTKSTAVKPISKEVPIEKVVKVVANPDEIIVKAGETLYSIAKTYSVTVDNLIDLNPQLSGGLKTGMVLKLRKSTEKPENKPVTKGVVTAITKPVIATDCYNLANSSKIYQVALLLPFLLEDADAAIEATVEKDPSVFDSYNYFQFYAGFMLAADSLEKCGLHACIQVMDADKLNDTLTIRQALRKPGMDKMDLIVGPMYASSFTLAARFAKKQEIGIINPLSHRENIVKGNPFVFKCQPSGTGIAIKLASFISSKYPNSNIIAVRYDTKEFKTLADSFVAHIKVETDSSRFKGTLHEAVYSTTFMAGVTKQLKPGIQNIVILFSDSKNTVPNFVSLLNPYSKTNDIILVGMDGWDDFELETEFLVNLNYHQVTSEFIDYESKATQDFINSFRSKYGAMPQADKHAFLGYDIGWYFLTSLMWYGDKYISCLPDRELKGLQYDFSFSGDPGTDGLQNQNIRIIKLSEYKMVNAE